MIVSKVSVQGKKAGNTDFELYNKIARHAAGLGAFMHTPGGWAGQGERPPLHIKTPGVIKKPANGLK